MFPEAVGLMAGADCWVIDLEPAEELVHDPDLEVLRKTFWKMDGRDWLKLKMDCLGGAE